MSAFHRDDCHLDVFFVFTQKSKGKFLYSAVSSPQDRSKRFTLYIPDRPVHSDTISASLGSIQPYAAINARRLLVHIPNIIYSQVLIFIKLSELEQCRVKNLPRVLTPQPGFEPGSRSLESEALPLSHCALQAITLSSFVVFY